ncbi:MAG: hypothetical protein REI45_15940 [Propionicimonas sp.]|nr:hypothetical protein [Propionicimonas sp.]
MDATPAGRGNGPRLLAWLVVVGYAAQLAWLAATAFDPGLRDPAPPWAAALAEPGSLLAMGVTIALGAAALVLVLVTAPARTTGRRIPLLVSAWAAVSAAPLAFAGYLPCPGDGPPLWDAISSTLSLFFGSFEKPFGPGQAGG